MVLQPTAWPLVLFCGFAGFVLWGFPGALGGSMVGFGFFWLSSVNVRERYKSSLPAETREDLSRAVLKNSRDLVRRAFPEVREENLGDAVGRQIDAIIWRAESSTEPDRSATSPGRAFSAASVERAVAELQREQKDPAQRGLSAAIWRQMQVEREWYG